MTEWGKTRWERPTAIVIVSEAKDLALSFGGST
jgi:hypothetical protein